MNPDQLRSRLQTVDLQGQLVITRTTFDDPSIVQLIDTYYGGNAIVIDNASIQPSATTTTQTVVTGKASLSRTLPNS